MTWLISLFGGLASAAFLKPFLTRIAILLGISVVTYNGISIGASFYWSSVASSYGQMPADVITVLGMMKIPNAINVIISSYVSALTVKGLTVAGSLKRAVWRPGQTGDLFGAG